MRQHVQAVIRLGRKGLRLLAGLATVERRRIAFGRVGRQFGQRIEQLRHAGAGARRHEQNGNQMPGAQGLLEGRMQLLQAGVGAVFEVARHQAVVLLDDLVDQRTVRGRHRFEIALAVVVAQQFDHLLAMVHRQVEQQALLAKALSDVGHQSRQVHVVGVDLVDHDHAAQAALTGQVEHALGGKLDAGLRVDHHQRGVHRGQRPNGLAGEVGVAGGIDDMDLRAGPVHADQRRLQRMAEVFFNRIEIADGVAFLDRTAGRDGAGRGQQALRQRGFPGGAVADQGNGTNLGTGVLAHEFPLESMGLTRRRVRTRALRRGMGGGKKR